MTEDEKAIVEFLRYESARQVKMADDFEREAGEPWKSKRLEARVLAHAATLIAGGEHRRER